MIILSQRNEVDNIKILYVEDNEVLIDDEDYNFITHCFDLSMNGKYVFCKLKRKYKGMGLRSTSLHKVLMLPKKTGRYINVDHKDGNENNYQKENLRVCSHQENARNRKPQYIYANKQKSSKYKGVYWLKTLGCWRADIFMKRGERLYIGLFEDEIAGANAYNHYAKIYHGEFACLNEVPFMTEEEWTRYRIEKPVTSKYRGVCFDGHKWVSQIWDNSIKKNIVIGRYETELEAVHAYNEKAVELKGDKAKLNIIH